MTLRRYIECPKVIARPLCFNLALAWILDSSDEVGARPTLHIL